MKQDTIVLSSIDLRRDTYGENKGKLVGSATFRNGRDDYGYAGESVEIKIVLEAAQVAKIVEVCGDSLKIAAQKKAQAFYETSAEMVGRLLENKKAVTDE